MAEFKCRACEDCGFVDNDGLPFSRIEAKDGKRPAWVGLAKRTPRLPCPHCSGGAMHRDEVGAALTSAAAEPAPRKKRKYTKRSPRWSKKS